MRLWSLTLGSRASDSREPCSLLAMMITEHSWLENELFVLDGDLYQCKVQQK
jgi:hypothetical protein